MAKNIRFVDLSVPLRSDTVPGLPPERELQYNPRITYLDHQAGAETMKRIFGITDDDLPDGLGWSNEEITLHSHSVDSRLIPIPSSTYCWVPKYLSPPVWIGERACENLKTSSEILSFL